MLTGSIRCVLLASLLVLPACSREQKPVEVQRARAALPPGVPTRAPVTPAPAQTRASGPLTTTPLTAPAAVAAAPRPTPVSETTAAKHLASMGFAPATQAPQLVMSDPKELERAADVPLVLMGFHLKGASFSAKRATDQGSIDLRPGTLSDEQAVIPASEWRKLVTGTYTVTVTGANGQTGKLPSPLSID